MDHQASTNNPVRDLGPDKVYDIASCTMTRTDAQQSRLATRISELFVRSTAAGMG